MDEAGIYARAVPDLERAVEVGVAGGRVISVTFPCEPSPGSRSEHDVLDRIEAYLAGEPEGFEDVTVGLTLPTDQRAVLEALRSVPYGASVTVEELTRMTARLDADDPEDRRAVGAALAANPAPLLIPDHRVVDGESAAPSDVVDRARRIEGIEAEGR